MPESIAGNIHEPFTGSHSCLLAFTASLSSSIFILWSMQSEGGSRWLFFFLSVKNVGVWMQNFLSPGEFEIVLQIQMGRRKRKHLSLQRHLRGPSGFKNIEPYLTIIGETL